MGEGRAVRPETLFIPNFQILNAVSYTTARVQVFGMRREYSWHSRNGAKGARIRMIHCDCKHSLFYYVG